MVDSAPLFLDDSFERASLKPASLLNLRPENPILY